MGGLTVDQPTAANLKSLVDQGTAASAANAWTAKVTDGTNVTAVKAASTAAVAADPAAVVALSPNQNTQALALFVRPRKLITYRAVFRTTTAPYAFAQALVASTRKQFASIHHAASATKTVRIKGAWLQLIGYSVASSMAIDFIRITAAPATGNPAITPQPADPADAAAEATCLALPGTAGTEVAVGSVYSSRMWTGGIAANSTNINDMAITSVDLLEMGGARLDDENKAPVIRAGVLEGWAVTLTSSSNPTITGIIIIDFTEE